MKKKMNKNLTVGLWLTGIMLTLILVGFFWTPYNPETMDNAAKLSGVSFSHLMGCDNFGRDIFSRVLKGGGTTFCVALGTVAIGTVFGVIIGAFTGYFGGILDEVLMRINDVLFAFPSILLALVFVTLLGGGTWNVIIALGIAFIPSFARIVRGEFIRCKNMDYVRSAKLAGAGDLRIMFVHILPNTVPVLLSAIMIGFNNAVLAEAGMSYLGLTANRERAKRHTPDRPGCTRPHQHEVHGRPRCQRDINGLLSGQRHERRFCSLLHP